ncbi:3'(2'),5'-bisphosphate nucleotidase CysQ [Roseixanthobacter glucoisosaccharinicivorans]|uniref:3'(2'),5'-bisphosphate nucleotidase CysQ n=1 Tax=Roseixanthobacter glucoisosaccharinicivorans TaxID=3119923 RepID=UPI003728AFF0
MSQVSPVPELVLELVSLALRAGRVILDIYATDFTVSQKADSSQVTQADRDAEALILKGLADLHPDIPVVAEEEAAAGRIPHAGKRFFLVDPLDGTREFVSRNGEFTVNIALIEEGAPSAGVVYAPALGVVYAGAVGFGAWKGAVRDDHLSSLAPIKVREAPARLCAIGSRSHGSAQTTDWLGQFPVETFRAAGSSLKFCLVAEGEADLYPRLGRTMEWDTAAGDAVLRAAGGVVTTMEGRPLTYGRCIQNGDAPFANPHFVAYGDQNLVRLPSAPARG